MKTILSILFSLSIMAVSAQEVTEKYGLFYKLGLATTLTINEDYVVGDKEDNEAFFRFNAFFLNNTVGYKFDSRSSIGLNLEYDWHSESGLQFLPLHLSFRYNVIQKDDNVFVRSSYGRLLKQGLFTKSDSVLKCLIKNITLWIDWN